MLILPPTWKSIKNNDFGKREKIQTNAWLKESLKESFIGKVFSAQMLRLETSNLKLSCGSKKDEDWELAEPIQNGLESLTPDSSKPLKFTRPNFASSDLRKPEGTRIVWNEFFRNLR